MFRLGKRSREEDADAASLDVRVPASALLNAVLRWRDACGQPYRVAHKLDISTDRAVLRVQKFDRITRAQARSLEEQLGPRHPYVLVALEFRVNEGVVAATIMKKAAHDESLARRLKRAADATAAAAPLAPPVADVSGDVDAEDEAVVNALATRVRSLLAASVSARATRRATDYEVEFRGAAVVSGRALAAAGEGAYVNFERKALIGRVARRTPDIVS